MVAKLLLLCQKNKYKTVQYARNNAVVKLSAPKKKIVSAPATAVKSRQVARKKACFCVRFDTHLFFCHRLLLIYSKDLLIWCLSTDWTSFVIVFQCFFGVAILGWTAISFRTSIVTQPLIGCFVADGVTPWCLPGSHILIVLTSSHIVVLPST